MKPAQSRQLVLLVLVVALPAWRLIADCSVTNLALTPLSEMGFATYSNSVGGLYPNGANTRPPAHDAAGMRIATNEIVPLFLHPAMDALLDPTSRIVIDDDRFPGCTTGT